MATAEFSKFADILSAALSLQHLLEFIKFKNKIKLKKNSSARILSPPLALFVVMLPKAYLTSNFRISGSR